MVVTCAKMQLEVSHVRVELFSLVLRVLLPAMGAASPVVE